MLIIWYYIIGDNMTEIENKLINNENITDEELISLLKYIINSINEIVNHPTFENKCDLVQGLIGRYLQKLNVKIYPCITNRCVANNVVGHSFIVADFKENGLYIIDPTFIQFLYLDHEFKDLYINHLRIKSRSPFHYARQINPKLLLKFLQNGFIRLTEESAYLFGNSFYRTLTSVDDKFIFKDIDGKTLINQFLKGDEILKDYGYPEIKIKKKQVKL